MKVSGFQPGGIFDEHRRPTRGSVVDVRRSLQSYSARLKRCACTVQCYDRWQLQTASQQLCKLVHSLNWDRTVDVPAPTLPSTLC